MSNIEGKTIINFMKKNAGAIVVVGLLVSLVSFFVLITTEKRFKVTTDLLIIQDQSDEQDFYSFSKSIEYLGGILSEAVYSSVFIDEVEKTGKIDKDFFPLTKKEKLKKWKKIVKVERNPQLGIIKIKVVDNKYENALGLAEVITEILTEKNHLFRGKTNVVDVRVLSGPMIERNPDNSTIAITVIGGFILGIILKVAQLYFSLTKQVSIKRNEEEYLESLRQQEDIR